MLYFYSEYRGRSIKPHSSSTVSFFLQMSPICIQNITQASCNRHFFSQVSKIGFSVGHPWTIVVMTTVSRICSSSNLLLKPHRLHLASIVKDAIGRRGCFSKLQSLLSANLDLYADFFVFGPCELLVQTLFST